MSPLTLLRNLFRTYCLWSSTYRTVTPSFVVLYLVDGLLLLKVITPSFPTSPCSLFERWPCVDNSGTHNCQYLELCSKVCALDVFLALSCHLTDEAKLDWMVPYIVELLNDDTALICSATLRTLMQVVCYFPYMLYPHLANLYVAHDCDCDHPFQCSHLLQVYHSQHQAWFKTQKSLYSVPTHGVLYSLQTQLCGTLRQVRH